MYNVTLKQGYFESELTYNTTQQIKLLLDTLYVGKPEEGLKIIISLANEEEAE